MEVRIGMIKIAFFLAVLPLIYCCFDCFLFGKASEMLEEVWPDIKLLNQELGKLSKNYRFLKPIRELTPHSLKCKIEKSKYTKYKRGYYLFLEYQVSGFVLLAINIVSFIIGFKYGNTDEKILFIVLLTMNAIFLWIFKFSYILHAYGSDRIASKLDGIVNEILATDGRIYNVIYELGIRSLLYIIGIVVFIIYYNNVINGLEKYCTIDFLIVLLVLLVFRYFVSWVIAYLVSFLIRKISVFTNANKSTNYYYTIIRNTVYLVFLTIYIVDKYIQIKLNINQYGVEIIESIGVLFLLDTYFDNIRREKSASPNIEDEEEDIKEECEPMNEQPKNQETDVIDRDEIVNIQNTAMEEYLNTVKMEYQFERDKKQSFESRAGILLTLLGAISIFYFQTMNFHDILILCNKTLTFCVLIKIITGLTVYAAFIVALWEILQTLCVRRLHNFEVKGINEALLKEERTDAIARLIFTYKEIIVNHRESNESRSRKYRTALKAIFVLIVSTVIYVAI